MHTIFSHADAFFYCSRNITRELRNYLVVFLLAFLIIFHYSMLIQCLLAFTIFLLYSKYFAFTNTHLFTCMHAKKKVCRMRTSERASDWGNVHRTTIKMHKMPLHTSDFYWWKLNRALHNNRIQNWANWLYMEFLVVAIFSLLLVLLFDSSVVKDWCMKKSYNVFNGFGTIMFLFCCF